MLYAGCGMRLPAAKSKVMGGLALGLAHNVKVLRPVTKGQSLSWADLSMDTSTRACQVRREIEAMLVL